MKIQKIYELMAESAYNNAIECTVTGNLRIAEPTPIYLQNWESRMPLFSYKLINEDGTIVIDEPITLHFIELIEINPVSPPSFNYLFWLEPTENNEKYIFKYIECGTVIPLPQLDIAYDDSTKIALNTPNSDILQRNCMSNYVIDAGKYKLLFIKAWQNGAQNWKAFGIREGKEKDTPRAIDIALEENEKHEKIRVLKKELYNKVCFPTRFDEIDILAYEEIGFVDIGQAQAARDALMDKEHRGDALVALWEEYSKIELEIAREERDELGKLEYNFNASPKNGLAYLELHINPDQTTMLRSLADKNAQLELICDKEYPPIVTLINFNPALRLATVEDELYRLPKSGRLQLSVLGDEIVDKRRRRAIKELFRGRTIVLQNLLFSIEDEANKMFEDHHKRIQALSPKTKVFLFEKFGVRELTENQREAVEIALNNRNDITIIQGPPGTGKTTVIAAICHRLLELSEKKKSKDGKNKTILASAFQNDTIEHLASKIYTHGLPTVKVGRKTMGVRAEHVFINDMERSLTLEIDKRGGESEKGIAYRLSDIAKKFNAEKNADIALDEMSQILTEDTPINGIDFDRLRDIKSAFRSYKRNNKRITALVETIPVTEEEYNFGNGFAILNELLVCGIEFSADENTILQDAPEMNPDSTYLDSLVILKERLIKTFRDQLKDAEEAYNTELSNWMDSAIDAAINYEETNYENEDEFIRAVLTDLKKDLRYSSGYIRKSLQEYGETVAATNQLAGSKEMADFEHIQNVILEEAARSNPLDLLIPMVQAEERIILVGDQNQLPHLLETEVAERSLAQIDNIDEKKEKRKLYEKSLFGIIYDNVQKGKRVRWITLEEQFRMHPTIGDFISNMYYIDPSTGKGKLKAGDSELYESKKHNLSLPWAKDKTMIFCDVDGSTPERKSKSKYRPEEAEKIMSLIDKLKTDPEFASLSIGVITFYSRQESVLFEKAVEHGYAIKSNDGYDIHPDFRTLDNETEKFRIGTVDSFQGKEFDIVILSTVRSNDIKREDGNEKSVFGFLTLKNRLNVAFSRAKKLIIVVGDAHMFEDEYAKKYVPGLYEFCKNITMEKPYGGRI